MANDNSAARNKPEASTNIKELRIEGERTAAMWANSVRVSRIDLRLRDLAASTSSEGRKLHRLGDTGYSQAITAFEDALSQIEKDLDLNSRRGKSPNQQNRRPQIQPQTVKQGQVESGKGQKPGNAEVVALPTPNAPPANATTKPDPSDKAEAPQAKGNAQPANPSSGNGKQPQNGQSQRKPGQQPQKPKPNQEGKGPQKAGQGQGQAKKPQSAQPQKPQKPNGQAQAATDTAPVTA